MTATIEIQVGTNAPDVAKAFAILAREQIPFATAVALTRTARDARDDSRGRMGEYFTLRNQRVVRGVTIQRAEKRDWPRPFALVGTRDEFMVNQILGGTKRPERGAQAVAIPTDVVRRTGSGRVRASDKPRKVRDRKGGFVVEEPAGPGRLVRQRTTRRRTSQAAQGPLQPGARRRRVSRRAREANLGTATLYLLRRSVKIEARWPFPKDVQRSAGATYGGHFQREFEAAMRSARRRGRASLSAEVGQALYLRARQAAERLA